MTRRIEIVANPASGSKLALSLAEQHVRPLLLSSLGSSSPDDIRIRQTESAADGVRIGSEIARDYLTSFASAEDSVLDLVLIGGDGTTHELLNGLYLSQPHEDTSPRVGKTPLQIRLAIVPGGTANALYSAMYPADWTQEVQHQVATASSPTDLPSSVLDVMLKSVRSLAASLSAKQQKLAALPLMLNRLEAEAGDQWLLSHLVTSHALHAAILQDADTPEMRAKHQGIERFKAAAQMNATRWTHGSVTLRGDVQRYEPRTRAFREVGEGDVQVEGPFLYLNAMVTDRLESAFMPAPLSSAFSDTALPARAVDVVAIRPRRDPTLTQDESQAAVHFATTRLGDITAGMYTGGKHVDMTFEGAHEPVVEYFRCAGYTFEPNVGGEEEGEKGKLVCTDGFVSAATRTTVHRWTGAGEQVRDGLAAPLVWL
ncbi:conserved hypothetical protein [Sporisorium reilianum SRZ2]|uniref:DAGKc domain-containing protein n=1 Tax=Sporisorium reilianum (strain SRZ2) TaxID=999809 RepID=E6ZPP9_SPORE|nr:conserved hypothetical protein [Sporisorium reilianum SRZ2]